MPMAEVNREADGPVDRSESRPINPYLVLGAAILLPGFGHVVIGETKRGFTFQLFMLALGFVTWQLAAPNTSFIGKIAGGAFIYALSIPDAYRIARLRWETYRASSRRPQGVDQESRG